MVRIGLIGCGYWGPKLLRNFSKATGAKVIAVCDLRAESLRGIQESWPGLFATTDADELEAATRSMTERGAPVELGTL